MLSLYSFIIRGAAPFAFALLLWRGFRERGYWQGLKQRFGFGSTLTGLQPIWLHAVSLGEISAAAPLIRALQKSYPAIPLLVTTATPAGRARASALFGAAVDIRYLPYDTPGSVRRFFSRTRPRLAVILETELWPNLFARCRIESVPLLMVNARLSNRSVSRYRRLDRWLGGLVQGLFTQKVFIAAQSAEDAERFIAIGAASSQVAVAGNIKFDIAVDSSMKQAGSVLRESFGRDARGAVRPVWIAGSTHAGEDEQVLAAHSQLLGSLPDLLLLLVPRHKDRFDAVAALVASRGLTLVRRSIGSSPTRESAVILGDTLGELAQLYAAADVAFVGGSLVPVGGHNLLEPAALGVPVITGPSHSNSKEVAQLLLRSGAAIEVTDSAELQRTVFRLLGDPGERQRMAVLAKNLVAANRGSVERLLELVKSRI